MYHRNGNEIPERDKQMREVIKKNAGGQSKQPLALAPDPLPILSTINALRCFKSVARANSLHRLDFEVLACIYGLSKRNEKQIGQEITCVLEILQTVWCRRNKVCEALDRLRLRSFAQSLGKSYLWSHNPIAWTITEAGKEIIQQYYDLMEEERIKANKAAKKK